MKVILAECLTHIGAVRDTNEDAVYADVPSGLFIVADGIGGQNAGEVASAIAVKTLIDKVAEKTAEDYLAALREGFYEANHRINSSHLNNKKKFGMGTTMTAAIIAGDAIYLAHVGDSRAYLLSGSKIARLTVDHSLPGELLKDGSITQEEADNHPQKNVLTRSLGQHSLVQIDEAIINWRCGDYLLLCSDGLYNLITDCEILDILLKANDIKIAAQAMVDAALAQGGYDNISVVIAYHE